MEASLRNSADAVIHSYVAKLERVFHPRSFVMRDGYSGGARAERDIHENPHTGTVRSPPSRARPRVRVYAHTDMHTHVGAPEILQYVIVRLERVS